PRGNAGVSLGTTVDFSKGAQGFIDEYTAQGRTVTAYDMKVSPQNEEAIRSFINSDPAAGTDSNKNIQARMMLAENCATGVCNALAAGGVGTNTPGKRAATSIFGTERPFTLQNNLERGPISVFVGQRVVFAPGTASSQPQQVPGMPKKMEEPKLCVFCSIQ
ncbi:MAG: hypothetical protein QOJ98_2925, partial [Acidobacteriota bacterium]|nr:hypothetical protein [Acidobacteriota bacterium]